MPADLIARTRAHALAFAFQQERCACAVLVCVWGDGGAHYSTACCGEPAASEEGRCWTALMAVLVRSGLKGAPPPSVVVRRCGRGRLFNTNCARLALSHSALHLRYTIASFTHSCAHRILPVRGTACGCCFASCKNGRNRSTGPVTAGVIRDLNFEKRTTPPRRSHQHHFACVMIGLCSTLLPVSFRACSSSRSRVIFPRFPAVRSAKTHYFSHTFSQSHIFRSLRCEGFFTFAPLT